MLGYEQVLVADPSLHRLPCLEGRVCSEENPCADVLLVDQYLPTMFGLDLIEKLNRRGCNLPAGSKAIITGVLSSQEAERAKSLGCDVLLKPVTFEMLKNWLSSVESFCMK